MRVVRVKVLPMPVKIVDRWHLLVNLREALERLLTRHYTHLTRLPASAALTQQMDEQQQLFPRPLRSLSGTAAGARAVRRARRYAHYE
jgi:hypothetical protein